MTQCDKLPASAIFHCPFVNKGEAFHKGRARQIRPERSAADCRFDC